MNFTSSRYAGSTQSDLPLPLAAVISLTIASYLLVVLVGIVLQRWLGLVCCSTADRTPTNGCCDTFPVCFSFGSGNAGSCCSNLGINCCGSSPLYTNCCNASTVNTCQIPVFSCSFSQCCQCTSQSIDYQSCDCCCFKVSLHLKGRGANESGTSTVSS